MDADSWRQAKSVLEAALLCAPAERDALIAARCADPSLRREVLACLNEHDEDFLESALTISHTFEHATSADDMEAPPDVQIGERIGRYEVVGRLGAGGMGTVFLGRDTELQRQVALKCLIASASAVDIRSRILHEARAAARINHPNIAVVHDVVEHDGRPFLVMEYVEGENLAQALKRQRPSLERILAIGRQLASALTAAHGKGIIHRDLKPANIQLMPDGSVKILDFGVAHAISMADVEPAGATTTTASVPLSTMATLRTERGAIRHPGTPAYMSPEQMFGKPIDQRSDIYSLGVILYEMSTGHRPYSTDDPLDVVLALSRNLLRPSGTETHLPDAVNDVIGKMLSVELDQRYQTAAEVESALVALIAPEPVAAPPVPATLLARVLGVVKLTLLVAMIPAAVVVVGFLTTSWFNVALGRIPPFSNESPRVWLEMGFRSLAALSLWAGAVFFAIWASRFVIRMLSLSRRVDLLLTTGRAQTKRLSLRLRLQDPVVLGQAFALIGVVALLAIVWRFQNVLLAVFGILPTNPNLSAFVGALRPDNTSDARWYRLVVDMLILLFGFGVLQISRLRARQVVRTGTGSLIVVGLMLTLAVLMAELPYRLMFRNKFERVVIAGARCYAIGQAADDVLAYCPDVKPPRNRIVKSGDPSMRRSGLVESIFTAPETSR